jgi:hydroxypyruvate isomerase
VPRFAANISLMYPEHALLARVGAAARDGFAAVEVQAPYALPAAELGRALADARVGLVVLNAPAGDPDAGERGLAALPGRERDFEASVAVALDYAASVDCPRLHVMAGVPAPSMPAADCDRVFRRNLAYACDAAHTHGIAIMIEPINTFDMPGYHLTRQQQAADVIGALARDNLRLQLDFYHLQRMEGELAGHLQRHFALVGHVQIAGAPGRNEPDVGEIAYPYLFRLLDGLGYRGWVGCEYRPSAGSAAGSTSAGLGWMRAI